MLAGALPRGVAIGFHFLIRWGLKDLGPSRQIIQNTCVLAWNAVCSEYFGGNYV